MTIDSLRKFCMAMSHVTEDIKWGDDLVFSVAKKMFVVTWMQPPYRTSFKCTPEEFAELVEQDGIVPAAYMARNHWVTVEEMAGTLDDAEMKRRIARSYELVKMKLPRKVQAEIDGSSTRPVSARTRPTKVAKMAPAKRDAAHRAGPTRESLARQARARQHGRS